MIIITRSHPGAEGSARRLRDKGYDVLAAPLVEISAVQPVPDVPEPGTLLVFTSRNGVRFFANAHIARHFPVVCVGHATAAEANRVGFSTVLSAGGTSEDVIDLVRARFEPCPVRHISGAHVRGRIVPALSEAGFEAERDVYYRQSPVPDWRMPAGTRTVLLYSPMAARLLSESGHDMSAVDMISISAATDAALGDATVKTRQIAPSPDEEGLFSRLGS